MRPSYSRALRLGAAASLCAASALCSESEAVGQPRRATGARSASAQLRPLPPQAFRTLGLQVALDRAGFSPGEIDAKGGTRTEKALRAFQAARRLPRTGTLDQATRRALGGSLRQPLVSYVISEADVQGPFIGPLPRDLMDQATLPVLGYSSVAELLAERFHTSERLLERLNAGAPFEAGRTLRVPNVEPLVPPRHVGRRPKGVNPDGPVFTVNVSARARTLSVTDDRRTVRMHAPVSVGSARDPLPTGEFKIVGVYLNPVFYYNPALFWDADPRHAKVRIAAGPNNPVGYVWLDLNREHLGLHGTPEPSSVGDAQSHGCIRLTNWDALRLASLVGEGTRVILR